MPQVVIARVHALFGRILLFPAYTVAAIHGHAFAGGAMLSAAFDARVMRADRGWWCLPEADLGLALTDPMYAVVENALPRVTLRESVLTGRRYTGAEAVAAGIVHAAVAEADVLESAVAMAASMAGKDRKVLSTHKRQLSGAAASACGFSGA